MHNRKSGRKWSSFQERFNHSLFKPTQNDKGTTEGTASRKTKASTPTKTSTYSKCMGFLNRKLIGVKLMLLLVLVALGCVSIQRVYVRRLPVAKFAIQNYNKPPVKLVKSNLSPFDSHPPKSGLLDVTGNIRHACLQEIRHHRHSFYSSHLENADHILLVDPAYHSNVGDHMITIAELTLLQSRSLTKTTLSQCSYVQAHDFVPSCDVILHSEAQHPNQVVQTYTSSSTSSTTDMRNTQTSSKYKVALWHGGGNFGNLWSTAQQARIGSIVGLLQANYTIIGMPNSWYYTNEHIESNDLHQLRYNIAIGLGLDATNSIDAITDVQLSNALNSRMIWTWREHYSYERAMKLLPYCTHQLVPDIAFQLGPYPSVRPTLVSADESSRREYLTTGSTVNGLGMMDIVFLLRNDHESTFASVRNRQSIHSMLDNIPGGSQLSFSIVDWDDRLLRFQPNNPMDVYFTETAIQLLSMGYVLICDRLHAAILAYISDLTFIYLDQISGKISKTFAVAMESGPNCQRSYMMLKNENFTMELNLGKTQKFWSHAETISGAMEMAIQIIQQQNTVTNGRNQRSITREQRRNEIRQKLIHS